MSLRRFWCAVVCMMVVWEAACGGYAELSLPVRQTAQAVVESQELYPGRLGTVQLKISLPPQSEPVSALWVVGAPDILSTNASETSWAYGPCQHPGGPNEAIDARSLRLCVAVSMRQGQGADAPFSIFVVVEDRGAQTRFDAVAEVSP